MAELKYCEKCGMTLVVKPGQITTDEVITHCGSVMKVTGVDLNDLEDLVQAFMTDIHTRNVLIKDQQALIQRAEHWNGYSEEWEEEKRALLKRVQKLEV